MMSAKGQAGGEDVGEPGAMAESDRVEQLFRTLARKELPAADVLVVLEGLVTHAERLRAAAERQPHSEAVAISVRTLKSCSMMRRIVHVMDVYLDDGAIQLRAVRLVRAIYLLFIELCNLSALAQERSAGPEPNADEQAPSPQASNAFRQHRVGKDESLSGWIYGEIIGNDVIQLLVEALVQYAADQELVESILRLMMALAFSNLECRSLLGDFGALDGIAQILDAFHENPAVLKVALDTMHILLGWPIADNLLEDFDPPRGCHYIDQASATVICSVRPERSSDHELKIARQLSAKKTKDLQRLYGLPDELKISVGSKLPIRILVAQYMKSAQAEREDISRNHTKLSQRSSGLERDRDGLSALSDLALEGVDVEYVVDGEQDPSAQDAYPLPVPLHTQNCARIASSGLTVRMLEVINSFTVRYAALRRHRKSEGQRAITKSKSKNRDAFAKESMAAPDGGTAEQTPPVEQIFTEASSATDEASGENNTKAEDRVEADAPTKRAKQPLVDVSQLTPEAIAAWRELAYRSAVYLSSGLAANRIGQKSLRGAEGVEVLLNLGTRSDRALRHAATVCLRWSLAGNSGNQEAFVSLGGYTFVRSSVEQLVSELRHQPRLEPCIGACSTFEHVAQYAASESIHLHISNALLLLYEVLLKSEVNQELAGEAEIVPFVLNVMKALPACVMVTAAGAAVLRMLSYASASREQLFACQVIPDVIDSLKLLSSAVQDLSSGDSSTELLYNAAGISELLGEHAIKTLLIMSSSRQLGLATIHQYSAQIANSCCILLGRAILRCSKESRNERNGVSSVLTLSTKFIDAGIRMLKLLTEDIDSPKTSTGSSSAQQPAQTKVVRTASPGIESSQKRASSSSAARSARMFPRTGSAFIASSQRTFSRGKSVAFSSEASTWQPSEPMVDACMALLEADVLDVLMDALSLYLDDYFLIEQSLTIMRNILRFVAPDFHSSAMDLLPATRRVELWDRICEVRQVNSKMSMVVSASNAALERLDPERYAAEATLNSPSGPEDFSSPVRSAAAAGQNGGLFSRNSSVKNIVRKLSHSGVLGRADSKGAPNRMRSKSRGNSGLSSESTRATTLSPGASSETVAPASTSAGEESTGKISRTQSSIRKLLGGAGHK